MTNPTRQPQKGDRIIIVGAGVFGLSTARELSRRGYGNVTVLDRYLPPVPDGSSVDISRVVRPDYADNFYAQLGLEAMDGWQNEYRPYFHQSGLLCATQDKTHPYLEVSKENLRKLNKQVESFEGNQARDRYPGIHGDLSNTRGYYNTECGWADAEGSMMYLARQCAQNRVSFMTGNRGTVTAFLTTNSSNVIGVQTAAGISIYADLVIVSTGAWTPHLLNMDNISVSNSQPVAFIQLTPEEAKGMQNCPVMIDLSTGWFAFPPTPGTNLLKMARHGYGYETTRQSISQKKDISAPQLLDDNTLSQYLPKDADEGLRDGLALFLPKFKDRPFVRKRLCWYTDTKAGDFIVDYHSDYTNLFMATGGNGHAFKFLPILGRYIADAIELKASQTQRSKWAWKPSSEPISKGDGSRGGPPRRILTKVEQAHL